MKKRTLPKLATIGLVGILNSCSSYKDRIEQIQPTPIESQHYGSHTINLSDVDGIRHIEIYGREMSIKSIDPEDAPKNYSLKTEFKKDGIYHIKYTDTKGNTTTRTYVKKGNSLSPSFIIHEEKP